MGAASLRIQRSPSQSACRGDRRTEVRDEVLGRPGNAKGPISWKPSNLSVEATRNGSAEPVQNRSVLAPAVDVFESESEVLVLGDWSGVVNPEVPEHPQDRELPLEVRRSTTPPGNPLATGYRHFDYRRTFLLSQSIDSPRTEVELELENGVPRIRPPKAESHEPGRIDIATG